MAGLNTLTFSDSSFDQDVLRSEVPVLVDFWAEWCGPCRQMGPTIDVVASEYAGKLKVGKLDVDAAAEVYFAKAPAALHSRWSLADIVADTLVLVRPKLAQAQVHVKFDPPAAALVVDAHKGQLQQVLLNLIFNSTEAMADGGELTLTLGETLRGTTPFATIDVADTGTGIPAELAHRIFDSFLSGRPGGTGLGLAIAKRILESHHGDIALVSTGPTGTVMRIALPLAKS